MFTDIQFIQVVKLMSPFLNSALSTGCLTFSRNQRWVTLLVEYYVSSGRRIRSARFQKSQTVHERSTEINEMVTPKHTCLLCLSYETKARGFTFADNIVRNGIVLSQEKRLLSLHSYNFVCDNEMKYNRTPHWQFYFSWRSSVSFDSRLMIQQIQNVRTDW